MSDRLDHLRSMKQRTRGLLNNSKERRSQLGDRRPKKKEYHTPSKKELREKYSSRNRCGVTQQNGSTPVLSSREHVNASPKKKLREKFSSHNSGGVNNHNGSTASFSECSATLQQENQLIHSPSEIPTHEHTESEYGTALQQENRSTQSSSESLGQEPTNSECGTTLQQENQPTQSSSDILQEPTGVQSIRPGAYAVGESSVFGSNEALGSDHYNDSQTSDVNTREEWATSDSAAFTAYTVSDSSIVENAEQRRYNAIRRLVFDQAPVIEGGVVQTQVEKADSTAMDGESKTSSLRYVMASLFCCIVVIVAGCVTTLVLMKHTSAENNPSENQAQSENQGPSENQAPSVTPSESFLQTAVPTSERFAEIKSVLQSVSGMEVSMDTSSPQYKAMVWLVEEDKATDINLNDTSRIVQRYALATLFFSTGGESSWIDDYYFLSAEHECNWHKETSYKHPITLDKREGVFCDMSNDLYILLHDNNLTGSIPEEMTVLSNLHTLALFGNSLTGPIPSTVGQLQNMRRMGLFQNRLTGHIPQSVWNLTKLRQLAMGRNHLTGTISPSVSNLRDLDFLSLERNNLVGTIPLFTGNLTMRYLELSGNALNGTLPSTIGLTQLAYISLSDNMIHGTIPLEIGNLTDNCGCTLNWGGFQLYLKNNSLSGRIPTSMGNLRNMARLDLSSNNFTGPIPASLGNINTPYNLSDGFFVGGFHFLDLSENKLSGEIPKELGNLTHLTTLSVAKNQLSGSVPENFVQLSSLKRLELEKNNLNGTVDFLCDTDSITTFVSDCSGEEPKITCDCCTKCCDESTCHYK